MVSTITTQLQFIVSIGKETGEGGGGGGGGIRGHPVMEEATES